MNVRSGLLLTIPVAGSDMGRFFFRCVLESLIIHDALDRFAYCGSGEDTDARGGA